MTLRLNGSTSGYVEINAPAVAGSTSITLPAVSGGQVIVSDSNGRVGIGSTSPSTTLSIGSSATGGYNGGVLLNRGASVYNFYEASDGTNTVIFGLDNTLSNAKIGSINSYPIGFYTGNVERARIDTSGRLLVGTSSARSNVVSRTPFAQFESATAAYTGLSVVNNSTAGYDPAIFIGSSKGSAVGSNAVLANGDGLGSILFAGADGTNMLPGAEIRAFVDGAPGTNDMPGRLVFSTTADGASSPTERFRINEKGTFHFSNTGTYTSAGGSYNEIYQTNNSVCLYARNTHSTTPLGYQIYYDTAVNNTGSEFLYCSDTSAQRAVIRSNGGFANYQANNVNLSDINTKKDISPAAGTWDCIKEWEIVNYRYKDQPDDADLNLGVIAQQVAESCPEVITVFQEAKEATEDQPAQEERLGVKEQQMYWMAIKALQEAQVRIEALEAEVAALKAS